MITLITGKPGMGKTSLLVSMLMKIEGTRPIFVMGVNDLAIEHSVCPPFAEWTEKRPDKDDPTILLDYYTFPPDSLIVVDEAQRVFRPRSSASKVPPQVAAYETHRHTGVDFILLTQSPKLIDSNIRELVGKHIHIGERLLGRYLFEWPNVGDFDNKSSREEAAKRRFKPPKASFKNFKSAEVHTKNSFRLNQIWIYLALALAFFSYAAYAGFNLVDRKLHPDKDKPLPVAQQEQQTTPRLGAGAVAALSSPPALSAPAAPAALPVPVDVNQPKVDSMNARSHPFDGWTFYIRGFIASATKGKRYYFDLIDKDGHTTPSDSTALAEAGYSVDSLGPCAVMIRHQNVAFTAVCRNPEQTKPSLKMSPPVPSEKMPSLLSDSPTV